MKNCDPQCVYHDIVTPTTGADNVEMSESLL